ncbi:MAG TPA: hypothetical protein DDZ51_09230, partial [Planctomycetaceae bacterium]|nr:hypothetical protein [Planctomycetaceae bacterium]
MFIYGFVRQTLVSFHSERVAMTTVKANRRPAMVLLVVLGMLTFFSILAASYLVFSNQSRQSSFVIAARKTRAPDARGIIDEALMKLVRGTDDATDPFFGEDLLSDFYGRFDSVRLRVRPLPTATYQTLVSFGFARIPIILPSTQPWNMANANPWIVPQEWRLDDVFTGRVVTFLDGELRNRTFRVIRSRYIEDSFATPPIPGHHAIYIELSGDLFTGNPTEANVRALFNASPTAIGSSLHMNGVPRNSPGYGFTGVDSTTGAPIFRNAPQQTGDV